MGAQAREAVGGDAMDDSVVTKVDHIVVPSKDVGSRPSAATVTPS
jgi:hypothetical protein